MYTDPLIQSVCEASFDPGRWDTIVRAIALRLAPGGCEIAFHPRSGRSPDIRLNAFRAVEGPARGAATSVSGEGETSRVSLVLARSSEGSWKIDLWSPAGPAHAPAGEAGRILSLLAPYLSAAFRLALDLQGESAGRANTLRDLWDPLPFGVMLLEPSLRLRFANMAADDLLRTRSLFRPFGREGFVQPTLRENFAALRQACEIVREGSAERASFTMLSREGEPAGDLTLFSLRGPAGSPRRGEAGAEHLVATLSSFESEARPFLSTLSDAPRNGASHLSSSDGLSV